MRERRTIIDFATIGLVILVVAILFWPTDSNGSDGNSDADDGPDTVQELEPDSDENADDQNLDQREDADDAPATSCVPGDATQLMADFVRDFNRSDPDALERFMPETSSQTQINQVYPGMSQLELMSFTMHDMGPLNDPNEVVEQLVERRETGEFWRLREFSIQRLYRDESLRSPQLVQLTGVIERSGPDFQGHELTGFAVFNCVERQVLIWEFATDDPDYTVPVSAEAFIEGLGPYGMGQLRSLRMIVSVDRRPDGGFPYEWEVRRQEATSYEGEFVERVEVVNDDGDVDIRLIFNGNSWHLDRRGWSTSGVLGMAPRLPLEIMLARREPSFTGQIVVDFVEEELGPNAVVERSLDDAPELLDAFSAVIGEQVASGEITVEFVGNSVRRTTYHLYGPTGIEIITFEIRWITMDRFDSYSLALFDLSWGSTRPRQQFELPTSGVGSLSLMSEPEEPGGDSEHYELSLDGIQLDLTVSPSLGGLGVETTPENWQSFWASNWIGDEPDGVLWADSTGFGVPTHAIWDNGRYRFSLELIDDRFGEGWGLDALMTLVNDLDQIS